MNEVQQVIGFLLQSCAEKDRTIAELKQSIEARQKRDAYAEAEPVKALPPRTIANG